MRRGKSVIGEKLAAIDCETGCRILVSESEGKLMAGDSIG